MTMTRLLAVFGAVALTAGLHADAQRKPEPPSIDFGGAQVLLGMTVEQVEKNLTQSARHIQFVPDTQTAIIRTNGANESEGQVNFDGGHVVYAAFDFPTPHNANELAQEIAGAVETMDTRFTSPTGQQAKMCAVRNYSSHGAGGGFSEIIVDCGSKGFHVMTYEILGNSERHTSAEITIGVLADSK
jgi:hypothetical protein